MRTLPCLQGDRWHPGADHEHTFCQRMAGAVCDPVFPGEEQHQLHIRGLGEATAHSKSRWISKTHSTKWLRMRRLDQEVFKVLLMGETRREALTRVRGVQEGEGTKAYIAKFYWFSGTARLTTRNSNDGTDDATGNQVARDSQVE